MRRALADIPHCSVIGDTTDAMRAVQLARDHKPSMIIAAPMLKDQSATPLLTMLHDEISPDSTIALFATDCPPQHFLGGVERWLSGYLLWHQLTPDTLRHCLTALLDGDIVLGNRAAIFAFAAALRGTLAGTTPTSVSDRDRAVLRELAEGRTVDEIAATLGCSPRSVRRSIEHLETVLDAPDRFVLAVKAMRVGLL